MGRSKILKFQDNAAANNVLEPGKPSFDTIKGQWGSLQFKNQKPLYLELACGYGEYAVGLGKLFPDRNYVGVDVKGSRIWRGSQQALLEGLDNVAFLRIKIHQLDQFFGKNEVAGIWIVHPDPRPKKSDIKRRLTHPRYLDMYKNMLKQNGMIHLKTDSLQFFEYTLDILNERNDVENFEYTTNLAESDLKADHFGITTRYEEQAIEEDRTIKYLKFSFTGS